MALEDLEITTMPVRNEGDLQSLQQVEAALGVTLPERLAAYITRQTGVNFISGQIKALGEMDFLSDGLCGVSGIYGLNDGRLGLTATHQTYNGRLMPGMIPIASTPYGGDQIVLSTGKFETGKVFFWWHEAPGPENAAESLCLLAQNIDDFCDRVEPAPVE